MAAPAPAHCDGCGRPEGACAGCRSPHDPPRFCPTCGRRLAVVVTPTGHRGRCRDHGPVTAGGTA
ncbi:hypothetical protein PO878_16380 [Iamia majanohamensis]|uniref:Uncharacterized protein n=1 Tax=Iamia majanohamensis TaxID=467976 RepID=A0AAE9Y7X1_9ACTN|nr:hypothetical protein [Iamia majanohamensis]WCO66078.1 hypothetical protein PO878_16380 [Iamia majanohamensis]